MGGGLINAALFAVSVIFIQFQMRRLLSEIARVAAGYVEGAHAVFDKGVNAVIAAVINAANARGATIVASVIVAMIVASVIVATIVVSVIAAKVTSMHD